MKFLRDNPILLFIITLGLILRLYHLDIPLLEFAPTRQVQTAETTKNLIADNYDLFHPRITYDGPNTQLFAIEFPGFNLVVALFKQATGLSLDISGRTVSIFSYLIACIFLFLIARNIASKFVANVAVFFFTFSPLNVLVSRSFIPDEMMLAFALGALFFLIKYEQEKKLIYFFASMIFFSWSALLKITTAFLLIPIFFLLKRNERPFSLFLIYSISVAIAFCWYIYGSQTFNNPNSAQVPGYSIIYRFRPHLFLEKQYYSNIFGLFYNLAFLPVGIVLFLFGIFSKIKKNSLFLYSWLISVVIYYFVFNVHTSTHEYYTLPFLPLGAIFMGIGLENICRKFGNLKLPKDLFLTLLFLTLMVLMLPPTVSRAYKPIERFKNVQEVGRIIENSTSNDDLIIGSMDAGPTLVYYSNRVGWGFGVNRDKMKNQFDELGLEAQEVLSAKDELEKLRDQGAVIFASAYKKQVDEDLQFNAYLRGNYKIIAENDNYVVFDLRK